MPNLRIISDNACSRASLTASTTAGSLAVTNLLNDIKGRVWRSTATSATLTANWSTGETIGGIALPHTNLSQSATIRVRLYSDAGVTLLYDSGSVPACPAAPIKLLGWGAAASGAMAYAYGGGSAARIWFAAVSGVKQVVIDLVDAGNSAGCIEASRLIAGPYWSPVKAADLGATLTWQDLSSPYRNDAGDLLTVVGTRSRLITLNLSNMVSSDRAAFISIVRANGKSVPLFFSLFPESADPELERDHEMYCRLTDDSAMSLQYCLTVSAPMSLEEV